MSRVVPEIETLGFPLESFDEVRQEYLFTFAESEQDRAAVVHCQSFGIDSPKANGITGLGLKELVEQKRYRDIAECNFGDIRATAELFKRWEAYLSFKHSSARTSP